MTLSETKQGLADYELIKPLQPSRSVQSSRLYLAHHTQTDSAVVIKLIPQRRRSQELAVFQHELQVLLSLQPFNQQGYWMSILDYGQDFFLIKHKREMVSYMVLPYFDHGNLADFIQQQAGLEKNTQAMQELLLNMLAGLDALHEQGWLHLDIKPANFLHTRSHDIILADFGLAQPVNSQNIKLGDGTQGTPKYMSPEQYLGQSLSVKTDYYALGLVIFELLSGVPAYQANSYHQWALQHCQQDIPIFPPALQQFQLLVDGLLAKNPEYRFSDGIAIHTAIKAAFHA